MNKRYILSADIGGTHSRFGLFEFQGNDDLIIGGENSRLPSL